MHELGEILVSVYDPRVRGPVVGYGTVSWPAGPDRCNGDDAPQPVYCIQVAEGSSSLGPACRVLRHDHAITLAEYEGYQKGPLK